MHLSKVTLHSRYVDQFSQSNPWPWCWKHVLCRICI